MNTFFGNCQKTYALRYAVRYSNNFAQPLFCNNLDISENF